MKRADNRYLSSDLICFSDVDECFLRPCKNGGTCSNSPGSYSCQCVEGYTGRDCQTGNHTKMASNVQSQIAFTEIIASTIESIIIFTKSIIFSDVFINMRFYSRVILPLIWPDILWYTCHWLVIYKTWRKRAADGNVKKPVSMLK